MQARKNEAEFDKTKSGTATWSSLDIFLFSNGQKYSPPRKYNLRASELDWWDATLNYLARAQYGSKHTNIDLYSTDGKRIGGPLELSNGTAYVAVEPPDSFVQSGYEQYLIKASRSWEKRQEKKNSDSALTKPDKVSVSNELIRTAENTDSTNIQIIQDIRIVPAATTAQDQTSVTVKSESISSKTKPNGVTNSIKQPQKKKTSVFQQRPSILRKSYVNPVSVPLLANKGPRVAKVDSTKKKIESTTKHLENVVPSKNDQITKKTTESKLESTDKIVSSASPVTQATVRNEFLGKNGLATTSTTPVAADTMENKTGQMDTQKDVILEKDMLSVSFHSEEYFQSILCMSANNKGKENLPISMNDTRQSVLNSIANEASNQFASTDDKVTRKNYVVSDSQTADNIVISISPGDTVKLKLNIEFENGYSSVDATKYDHQSKLVNPEKHDMLDANTSLTRNSIETQTVITESWQSNLTNENTKEGINDMKFTICRCNCCSNTEKILPAPIYVDNNNYFILLPAEKNNEKLISCNCKLENSNSKNDSEGDENGLFLTENSDSTAELEADKDQALSISKVRVRSKISECQCQTQESAIVKNQTSTFGDNEQSQCVAIEYCMCYNDDSQRNVSNSMLRLQSPNIPKIVKDRSTQTHWNNILLEARLHKDGHYTFHMPPLDKIKFDNTL